MDIALYSSEDTELLNNTDCILVSNRYGATRTYQFGPTTIQSLSVSLRCCVIATAIMSFTRNERTEASRRALCVPADVGHRAGAGLAQQPASAAQHKLCYITWLTKIHFALTILVIAQTYVVYTGYIDLSAGAIISIGHSCHRDNCGKMVDIGFSVVAPNLFVGLLTGLICSIVNGVVMTALRLQAIVVTLLPRSSSPF